MLKNLRQGSCYLIAEIGGNFTTFEEARRLVDEAVGCGVDAVKLQTYRAETVASRHAMFDMENTGRTSQFELFRKYQIDEAMHREVFAYIEARGLDWFSTPSHPSDVRLLEHLGAPAYKIGSDDADNLPFLAYVAATGKPLMLSTGMCTMDDVEQAVDAIHSTGNRNLTLLHAITSYPTHALDVNLRAMTAMSQRFPGVPVGYSDHTIGPVACLAAAAMGASVIEKHFTWDRNAEGPDHMLSADPAEMTAIVEGVRAIEAVLGDGVKRPAQGEAKTRINNRKSVVAIRTLDAGQIIVRSDLDVKRPGTGIRPRHIDELVGRQLQRAVEADQVLGWDDFE